MPSPFPGMNPYLEQDDVWHDFHKKIIPAIAERLVAQVRPKYIVKIDEHVYVHEIEPDAAARRFLGRADLSVASAERVSPSTGGRAASSVAEASVEVRLPADDVERLAFVEIRDRRNRELITVIEVLSPANKRPGADRELYLNKRREILGGPVHLVEIDLLRTARPLPLLERPDCVHSILVSRSEERPYARFWPIALQDRLPIFPVPLTAADGMLRLTSKTSSTRYTTPRVTRITSTPAPPSPPYRPRISRGLID
jgi:hypothetical protein